MEPLAVLLVLTSGIALGLGAWFVWLRASHSPSAFAQRARLGWGLNVRVLAQRLDLDETTLQTFQPYYRSASIAKRGGGRRELRVPNPETKALQRKILHHVLARLRSHPAAFGFERGRSIVDNARPHAGQAVVIRMDLVDFFPSIPARRVEAYFRRIGWGQKAANLLTRLCTDEDRLPQGAPTSPRLSNLVNHALDARLAGLARKLGATYTRYADDITFSFPEDRPSRVHLLIHRSIGILRSEGYRVHRRKKLHIRRRHQQQVVTGLVVNDRPAVPRAVRRRLRAIRHHLATGRPATLAPAQLAGWDAFAAMVAAGAADSRD